LFVSSKGVCVVDNDNVMLGGNSGGGGAFDGS
jgi:hypothetical protein